MSVTSISEFGKTVSELGTVKSAQLWSEALQRHEFRGLGDTREAARGRVADNIGVPESWLKRLRYKARELNEVPGTVLFRLAVAYDQICLSVETAADDVREERLALKDRHHAAHEGHREAYRGTRPALA